MFNEEVVLTKELADGREIRVFYDSTPSNPREWSNVTGIVGWHRRRQIGDHPPPGNSTEFLVGLYTDQFPELEDMNDDDIRRFIKDTPYPGVLKPLYMYEHGNVAFSTDNRVYPFSDQWDAGQVGFVYITPEKLAEENITLEDEDRIGDVIRGELSAWQDYANGHVYGVVLYEKGLEDQVDSLWDVYLGGDQLMETELDKMLPDIFGPGNYEGTWKN